MDAQDPTDTSADTSTELRSTHGALKTVLDAIAADPDGLERIIAESGEALIAFDPQRRIIASNRPAEALFGYAHRGLAGRSTDDLLPPRLRQPEAPPMIAGTDLVQVDLPGQRLDGSELVVEWVFGAVVTASATWFVMTVRDRAAVDRALGALRESESRFQLLVDGVRDYAIFMLDPSGRVSSWNRGAERTKGWTADEVLGKSYELLFTPEDRGAGAPARLLADAGREGTHEATLWLMRKDGTRFRASAQVTALRSPTGTLQGFAQITRDLTERLQAQQLEQRLGIERAAREAAEDAERRVRAGEDRLRRLQQITAALSEAATPAEVAAVVLAQSLQALDASGGAVYTLAASGTELDLLDQRGHPELAAFTQLPLALESPITDAARDRTARFYDSFEACAALYPALRDAIASGGFEASAALPLITRGAVLGVFGIRFRTARTFEPSDRSLMITVSELCAQALERAHLFEAERAANRSKDEFLAMLGHELRNPLAPIVTALSMMELEDDAASQRGRTVIRRQVAHLERLVDDLLDVSRITQGKIQLKRERVELAAIVDRAVELASPLLEERAHHLTVSVAADGLPISGDPTRLAQVISNLLSNAAKYTPAGGHIELAARRELAKIVLTVRDDGVGIATDMLSRVFEVFAQERQSIDRSLGGLGLGLAIVKSLVAMHGGTVAAASAGRGCGSVFTVELPADTAAADASPANAATRIAVGQRVIRRVLVVDDNPDAADLLAELLRAHGHVAMVAHDGPAALEVATSFLPDVALLDLGLPVMDGYELATRLRALFGSLRLVAVTGYGAQSDRQRTTEAGFDIHMVKPVATAALFAALE